MHVRHPALQADAIEFRGFQVNLARIAGEKDTLVVVPTGMGKTVIALLVLADALRDGASRVLIMAPTKPLVEQHAAFLEAVLTEPWRDQVHTLTGHVPPAKRTQQYEAGGIVVATPQVISNDVIAGNLDVARFDWVVFDEAHRAVGEYPYAFLGRKWQGTQTRRLALTASPGHDPEKVQEVLRNLGIRHVEIRTPNDPDVAEYVQNIQVEWETLPLPTNLARVSKELQAALAERVLPLKQQGVLKSARGRPSRKALLEAGHRLQAMTRMESDVAPEVYAGLSLQAQAMKLLHAIELAETQGAEPFRAFIDNMRKEADSPKSSKATRRVAEDPHVVRAVQIAKFDQKENPKLGRTEVLVQEALEGDPNRRVIVFASFRSTCEAIANHLGAMPNVHPVVFVGQGRRKGQDGLTQKQQQEVLAAFSAGEHNVLVATSVAEEGLDIPETDLVVFYEPISSEIRSIQRRGRTGRHRGGRVVVLMTRGTQDEAAHWSARRKEKQMVQELQLLRTRLGAEQPPATVAQARLDAPPRTAPPARASPLRQGPHIAADHREQAGGVVRHLHDLGVRLEMKNLDVGDFVLSDRIVVERKETADFVGSLVDARLFEQMKALQVYPKPFLVIEGESLFGHRNVSAEAILGALASITVDLGVPVIQTRSAAETSRFLVAVAKREQNRDGRKLAIRPGKTLRTPEQQARFVLAGFPLVDDHRARALLDHFGSLAALFGATEAELAAVPGIGPKIAASLRGTLDAIYRPETVMEGT